MKKVKKILPIIISAILIFTPCYANAEETNEGITTHEEITENQNGENDNQNTTEAQISLNKETLDLDTGKSATLTATTTPEGAAVIWSSSDDEIAKVDTNGKVTAGTKAGSATITASIEGTEKSATCTVNVTRSIGKDATLKSLTITNGDLDQTFKSDVLEYSVTVEADTNSLRFEDLQADLNDANAGYLVTGNSNLKNGSVVKILVTAEDKTTQKTYQLTIVKDTVSLALKKLEITGYALNESFDKDTLEYTASIPYEIQTISVVASPESDDATVKVSGLTNLVVGQNTVTITVKDEAGNTRKYTIVVTREKEVSVEENPTSIITSSDNNTTSSNSGIISGSNNNDSFLKYAIVSIACLILFAIGGIGIYFYIKTSPKKLKKAFANQSENQIENQPENPTAIVEVNNDEEIVKHGNIEEIMDEKLVETREFKVENLEVPEDLFDDSEDV